MAFVNSTPTGSIPVPVWVSPAWEWVRRDSDRDPGHVAKLNPLPDIGLDRFRDDGKLGPRGGRG